MEKDEKLTPSLEDEGCDVNTDQGKPVYDSPSDSSTYCSSAEEAVSSNESEDTNNSAGTVLDTIDEEAPVTAEADDISISFKGFEELPLPDLSDYDESKIIRADGNFDADQWIDGGDTKSPANKVVRSIFDFLEMLALVTVAIVLCFSFVFRLNIVDGPSMENTLHTGEYLIVSDLFYEPTPGDIVVVHDMTAVHYTDPIVKRVIAVEGQTIDIDFSTWTLTVDGKVVDESSYRLIKDHLLTSNIHFPVTVPEDSVFVMGDNRNHSADSRLSEIGMIDERCVVGKVYARIFPFNSFTVFKNPYND